MFELTEVWQSATKDLWENEFFQGGFVVTLIMGVLGAIWYYTRQVPFIIGRVIHRYTTVHMKVNKGETYFKPLLQKIIRVHGNTGFGKFINVYIEGKAVSIPSGLRWHRIGLAWFRVTIADRELDHSDSSDAITYTISIAVYGFRRRSALEKFLKDALEESTDPSVKMISYWHMGGFWRELQAVPRRSASSIITSYTDEIIRDLREFDQSRAWYHKNGIPFRRGVLFYGPPGTGKTSLAIAIANELGKDLRLVQLQSMTSASVREAFAGSDNLIVIEDMDVSTTAAHTRSNSSNKDMVEAGGKMEFLTLSDILNAIDGVTSGTGNILIVTTNNKDNLDSALLRPGRIDKCYEIGYLNQDTFDRLCVHYYGNTCNFRVSDKLTAAEVQGVFIKNKDSIESFEAELWTKTSQT